MSGSPGFPTLPLLAAIFLVLPYTAGVSAEQASAPPGTAGSSPDAVYYNGKILTADPKFSIVEAFAVKDGRINATGPTERIRKLAGEGTRLVDLKGHTVIPGLIDNHIHFMRDALRWSNETRLDGITSRREALRIISEKARALKPGQPILVLGGWGELQFADKPGAFTREELDQAAPENPVILQKSYMALYMNTLASRASGSAAPPASEGRDPAQSHPGSTPGNAQPRGRGAGGGGNRAGIRGGGGMQEVNRTIRQFTPELTEQEKMDSIRSLCTALNGMGLTTLYDVGQPMDGPMERLETLRKQGNLTMRVFHTLRYAANNPAQTDQSVAFVHQTKPFQSDDWTGIIGMGEHLYNPIHDSPMQASAYPDEDYAQFEKLAEAAAEGGWPVQEHAMRDETIRRYLDIFERIHAHHDLPRWTLAHCDTMSPESLGRALKLGLTLAIHNHTVKPAGHSDGDSPPVKAIQESGIVWGLGSDGAVVAPVNPFSTLWWVVTGKIYPDRRVQSGTVSREQALIAHTRSNAYLLFKEKDLGSLEPGKLADFVVLDRDYMTIPEDQIKEIKPLQTVVGGKLVFGQESL